MPADWPPWNCPAHLIPLSEEPDRLVCPTGHAFPVRAAIPRFVGSSTYADAFGAQWNRYRVTQLDSHTGTTISRDRVRRCIGDELWSTLAGQHVLECGCGAGRFTEVLLDRGALVTSVDLSDAVGANSENFGVGPSHRIAQADIEVLPFAPRQFDVVFCLGVIQHTPSPERTIGRLYDHVRPGGFLVVDHYRLDIRRLADLSFLYRAVLRHLPPRRGLRITERLVDAWLPLHQSAARFAPLVRRISGVVSYYRAYPQLPDAMQREWSLLDTHDSLTDWYKRLRTRGQIQRSLEQLGARVEICARQGNGIEARARRPDPSS
ncbi:MAG: class I SAM-dependent methyltransferase [Actinomycetota bacterium]|nr:class I SAM-dependent methyltransferase [Actinomycetota bacterium]